MKVPLFTKSSDTVSGTPAIVIPELVTVTSVVLAGEAAGSKLRKAEKLGVEVIDDEAFRALLEVHGVLP